MSIQSRLTSAYQSVASAIRSTRSTMSGNVGGNISGLNTISKSSLLASINEIVDRRNIGFRYSFALTGQARATWIQPTTMTAVRNNPVSTFSYASGAFTFGANTVANVVGNWLFHAMVYLPDVTACSVGVSLRIGGTEIARGMVQSDANPFVNLTFPYRITGGEVITFHVYHTYAGVLGLGSSTAINGLVSGVPL